MILFFLMMHRLKLNWLKFTGMYNSGIRASFSQL